MKPLLLLACVLPVLATPIPVTGTGSFSLDSFHSTYADVCLDGESVHVCANGIPIGPGPPSYLLGSSLITPRMSYSSATVDGVSSTLYALSLGGYGDQYLEILDTQGHPIARQDISGVIQITSYQQFGGERMINGSPNGNWFGEGTFTVAPAAIPVPEPSALQLVGAALLLLLSFALGRVSK